MIECNKVSEKFILREHCMYSVDVQKGIFLPCKCSCFDRERVLKAAKGDIVSIELLEEDQEHLNAALLVAVVRCNAQAVKILLECGAQRNVPDCWGHYAEFLAQNIALQSSQFR